jgi:purine nucleosidase
MAESVARTRIILDCDPGIDDALALLLAAASPELELLAVTCVAGNRPVDTTSANARKLLDLAQCAAPVHVGAARPLAHAEPRCNEVHGVDGLGGVELPMRRPLERELAATAIVRILSEEPLGSVAVVGTAPLTNLALAEILAPGILRRAGSILVMGGAAFCPGNVTPSAEFNFHCDAVAAHVVLTAQASPVIFGLDVTKQAAMPQSWIAAVANLDNRCGPVLGRMLGAYALLDPLLHDVCPVAYLLEPDLFRGQLCSIATDWREGPTEGKLSAWSVHNPDRPRDGEATIMTDVDAKALLDVVLRRLANLP